MNYSVPILWDILDDERLQHYLKLVTAIRHLSSVDISPNHLTEAGELLESFSEEFERLYGENYLVW